MRCCGVLCRHACFASPCVVFCCRLVAGWCLVLMPVLFAVAGGRGSLVLLSGGVPRRWGPCLAAWSIALSLRTLAWFPGASCSPLLCLVLPCGAVLWRFPVPLPLLLVFVFALYFEKPMQNPQQNNLLLGFLKVN